MCGIVGYIGKKESLQNILKGLKNLEYRGYDSSGIAYVNEEVNVVKSKGRIANLEEKLNLNELTELAICHTRWATHGLPNDVNAHPHKVGNITVVHNGILENYQDLKTELIAEGVEFKSETDTEVISAVLNKYYQEFGNIKKSIQEFLKVSRGAYALGIIVDGDDNLYVVKKESPLIVAIANDGFYIASDVPAILEFTNKYFLLNDLEYAVLSKNGYQVYDNVGNQLTKEIKTFSQSASSVTKNGFDHFMLKEIFEQEGVCRETFNYYLENFDLLPDISKYNRIDIVGCGSAYNVSLVGKYLMEEYLNIPVNVDIASEYRYRNLFVDENSLVIFISQSGETADTLAAVKKVKKLNPKTLGIINVVESSIAREVDEVIYTKAGIEIAVATTKAFVSQLIVLILITLKSALSKGSITEEEFENIKKDINLLPSQIAKMLENRELYSKIAECIYEQNDAYFIGRGVDYALTHEGSLKLKEVSYIHCDSYAAGELKHGTISLIDKDTPVFGLITDDGLREKMISNLNEVDSRGARVILISTESVDKFSELYVEVPKTNHMLQSILTTIPLQMIAYETAKLRGCDIDKPKNLAKSVTVE